MMKKIYTILSVILVSFLISGTLAFGDETFTTEEIYSYAQETIESLGGAESVYSASAGISTNEWMLIATTQLGVRGDKTEYRNSLEAYIEQMYQGNLTNTQPTQWYRLTLAALACGMEPTDIAGYDLVADGIFYHEKYSSIGRQGINGWVWALIALDATGCEIPSDSEVDRQTIISKILELQHEDGSFSLMGAGDPDVTSMVLQALAPYKDNESCSEAVQSALSWLAGAKQPSGAYISYGYENAESTAQVILALAALGIDPQEDSRFAGETSVVEGLLSFRTSEGTSSHLSGEKTNGLATAQSLLALTALYRLYQGKSFIYCFDAEAIPEEVTEEASSSEDISSETLEYTVADETVIITAESDPLATDYYESSALENTEAVNDKSNTGNAKKAVTLVLTGLLIILIILTALKPRGRRLTLPAIVLLGIVILLLNLSLQTPEDYYSSESSEYTEKVHLIISCQTATDKPGQLPEGLKAEGILPDDGIILDAYIGFNTGDTVFDILVKATREYSLQMEYSGSEDSAYIKGIACLYEYDMGDLSGWMYSVDGEFPNVSCGAYIPEADDEIRWDYTCDLGRDLGE